MTTKRFVINNGKGLVRFKVNNQGSIKRVCIEAKQTCTFGNTGTRDLSRAYWLGNEFNLYYDIQHSNLPYYARYRSDISELPSIYEIWSNKLKLYPDKPVDEWFEIPLGFNGIEPTTLDSVVLDDVRFIGREWLNATTLEPFIQIDSLPETPTQETVIHCRVTDADAYISGNLQITSTIANGKWTSNGINATASSIIESRGDFGTFIALYATWRNNGQWTFGTDTYFESRYVPMYRASLSAE